MRFIYLSLLFVLFASCDDITVGYLDAENATYGIDSLLVERSATEQINADIENNGETYYTDLINEYYNLVKAQRIPDYDLGRYVFEAYTNFQKLDDAYELLMSKSSHLYSQDELLKISSYYNDALALKLSADKAPNSEIYQEPIYNKFNSVKSYSSYYSEKRLKRHAEKVPWVTNSLQGVEGSYPIRYELASIRSLNNNENAEKMIKLFSDPNAERYTGLRGNGSIQIPYDTDLPADTYIIDIKIRNEEREYIKKDVLKIIIR
ncbi:MAG: hypothetical protein N4A49_14870 [Marinifilaceae bacterium]|jgi:hypothetical protein|nr:hypothetical protein [Marinifilaceae bacterium]